MLPAVVAGPPFAVSLMSLSHYKFSSHLDTSFAAAWLGGGGPAAGIGVLSRCDIAVKMSAFSPSEFAGESIS